MRSPISAFVRRCMRWRLRRADSGSRYEGRLERFADAGGACFPFGGQAGSCRLDDQWPSGRTEDLYSRRTTCRQRTTDRAMAIGWARAPTLASEAPIYLCWPAGRQVRVKAGAAVLKDVAIHRHIAGKTHLFLPRKRLAGHGAGSRFRRGLPAAADHSPGAHRSRRRAKMHCAMPATPSGRWPTRAQKARAGCQAAGKDASAQEISGSLQALQGVAQLERNQRAAATWCRCS